MEIIEVKDISKNITVKLKYDEWYHIIYLLEKERLEHTDTICLIDKERLR